MVTAQGVPSDGFTPSILSKLLRTELKSMIEDSFRDAIQQHEFPIQIHEELLAGHESLDSQTFQEGLIVRVSVRRWLHN